VPPVFFENIRVATTPSSVDGRNTNCTRDDQLSSQPLCLGIELRASRIALTKVALRESPVCSHRRCCRKRRTVIPTPSLRAVAVRTHTFLSLGGRCVANVPAIGQASDTLSSRTIQHLGWHATRRLLVHVEPGVARAEMGVYGAAIQGGAGNLHAHDAGGRIRAAGEGPVALLVAHRIDPRQVSATAGLRLTAVFTCPPRLRGVDRTSFRLRETTERCNSAGEAANRLRLTTSWRWRSSGSSSTCLPSRSCCLSMCISSQLLTGPGSNQRARCGSSGTGSRARNKRTPTAIVEVNCNCHVSDTPLTAAGRCLHSPLASS
jgi:hypothetical protein